MIQDFIEFYNLYKEVIFRVAILLAVGIPILKILSIVLKKALTDRFSEQQKMVFSKTFMYAGTTIIIVMVAREFGMKLTTLLGAAGIMGIAIGFAAQTSLSNLISGVFLIWETPFRIGDFISTGTHKGIVYSINLLSVQLKTFDNQLIRIPNESLIKTPLTNITRFPIRRMDMDISVAFKEDIQKVMDILKQVADANPYCLDEPEPVIIFKGFGDSALEFLFAPWFAKEDYIALRNSILKEVKIKFDEENIEIPFPHRTLYTGLASQPFPVKILHEDVAENITQQKNGNETEE